MNTESYAETAKAERKILQKKIAEAKKKGDSAEAKKLLKLALQKAHIELLSSSLEKIYSAEEANKSNQTKAPDPEETFIVRVLLGVIAITLLAIWLFW